MDVAVLGPVELRADGGPAVPVAGARLRALLILLVLDANRAVSADRLIGGVWADDPPAAAGNALQALISRLRRAGLVIEAAPTGYQLVIDTDRVDLYRFERLAGDPATAGTALGLWRGPLDFPDVARASVVRLEELRLAARQEVAAAEVRRGAGAAVVAELEELTRTHPLHEPLAGLLMRALVAAGRPGRALEVFERIRRELADELGADPSPALAALHLEILKTGQPPTKSADQQPAKGNLPSEVSSFVGRDSDVRAVRELIAAHRLVTLIGPGGSGKTRLSVEVGHAETAKAVWRVELAPVTDPGEVPQTVLSALGLRSQIVLSRPSGPPITESIAPLARLQDALAGKEMLLILDNCEHLIGAAAELADALLRAAPGLRLLATSREPLGIPGEQLWPVEPLALPPEGGDPALYPAVRLLLDRAGAARPGFALTAETAAPVVRICRALDGMPLAIELAAARLRTLPVQVLADRLADRFQLLTGGSRAALPRHQTLRAVVDWSWDLLGEPERELWRRFAVFHGGADVAAVEQVCGADLALVGALVDKSLLVLGANGRYRMLETIREYGLERLAAAGETERMRLALAGYLLALARAAEPNLRSAEQLRWLGRLTEEHDNLHAAIRAAIEAGDAATATALTARLGWYWWLRGHRAAGTALAREVLALPGDGADPEDVAVTWAFTALNGLEGVLPIDEVETAFRTAERLSGSLPRTHPVLRLLRPLTEIFEAGGQGVGFASIEPLFADPDPWLRAIAKVIVAQLRLNFGQSAEVAEAEMRAGLAGFRALGERWGLGMTLSSLANLAAGRGDFRTAVAWRREAIALVREVGIREDLPELEAKLAQLLWRAGEHAEARRMLKQAQRSAEDVGVTEVMASVEYGYATIAREEGALDEARARMRLAAALSEGSTFAPQFRALTRSTQGLIEAAAGDLGTARVLQAEALDIAVQSQDAPVVAQVLVGVADLALRGGDPARAARLLGAADAVRGSTDRSLSDVDRIEAAARAALGDAGYEQAYLSSATVTTQTAKDAADLG